MRPAPGGPGPKRLPPSRRVLLDDPYPERSRLGEERGGEALGVGHARELVRRHDQRLCVIALVQEVLAALVPSGRVEGGHLKSIRSGTKVPSSPQIGERSFVSLPAITPLAPTSRDRPYLIRLAG